MFQIDLLSKRPNLLVVGGVVLPVPTQESLSRTLESGLLVLPYYTHMVRRHDSKAVVTHDLDAINTLVNTITCNKSNILLYCHDGNELVGSFTATRFEKVASLILSSQNLDSPVCESFLMHLQPRLPLLRSVSGRECLERSNAHLFDEDRGVYTGILGVREASAVIKLLTVGDALSSSSASQRGRRGEYPQPEFTFPSSSPSSSSESVASNSRDSSGRSRGSKRPRRNGSKPAGPARKTTARSSAAERPQKSRRKSTESDDNDDYDENRSGSSRGSNRKGGAMSLPIPSTSGAASGAGAKTKLDVVDSAALRPSSKAELPAPSPTAPASTPPPLIPDLSKPSVTINLERPPMGIYPKAVTIDKRERCLTTNVREDTAAYRQGARTDMLIVSLGDKKEPCYLDFLVQQKYPCKIVLQPMKFQ